MAIAAGYEDDKMVMSESYEAKMTDLDASLTLEKSRLGAIERKARKAGLNILQRRLLAPLSVAFHDWSKNRVEGLHERKEEVPNRSSSSRVATPR